MNKHTIWNICYHWKQGVIYIGLLIGGAIILTASTHTVTCANWNDRYFHWDTTASFIRQCLTNRQVDINQQDEDGQTLLHRIVADISEDDGENGNSIAERTAMIDVLLGWASVNVDAVDASDRTPLHYALKKSDTWPVAAKLLDAGANPIATPRSRHRIQKQWVPILGIVQRHASKDIVDLMPSGLLTCEDADCLIDSLLKKDRK